MILHVTFPSLLALEDLALFILRLIVAIEFGASGCFDLKDPGGRAKSLGLSVPLAVVIGVAEVLGPIGLITGVLIQPAAIGLMLIGLGAIQKKVFAWKTGFWGDKGSGWHYDLMLLSMNLVIVATAGGRWVVPLG